MTDLEVNLGKHIDPYRDIGPSGWRTVQFLSKFSPTEPPPGWFWNYSLITVGGGEEGLALTQRGG